MSGLEVRKLGLVIAATITQDKESITEHLSSVHARFEKFAPPPTSPDFSELEEIMSLPLGCMVEDATVSDNVESDYDPFFVEPASEGDSSGLGHGEAISAGDALTLMTPAGSWTDLLPTSYFRSGIVFRANSVS